MLSYTSILLMITGVALIIWSILKDENDQGTVIIQHVPICPFDTDPQKHAQNKEHPS